MEMSLIIARGIDGLRLMLFSFMNSTIAYFFMKQMLEKKDKVILLYISCL